MAVINQYYVQLELQAAQPIILEAAKQVMRREVFVPAVQALRQEFENHKVTKELDDGMNYGNAAGNPTQILAGSSPKTLYTFIGFDEGTHPTNAIRNRISNENSAAGPKLIALPVKKRRFVYEFEVLSPDLDEIYKATPLPWASGFSWAEMIERGIPGLGRFVAKDGYGHSGGGIESKKEFRNAAFSKSKPIEYLSEIVRHFVERLKSYR